MSGGLVCALTGKPIYNAGTYGLVCQGSGPVSSGTDGTVIAGTGQPFSMSGGPISVVTI